MIDRKDITREFVHRAVPGRDPKPKHLSDGYERTRCTRCGNKVGYAEYDAYIDDLPRLDLHRLVYLIQHKPDVPCETWS